MYSNRVRDSWDRCQAPLVAKAVKLKQARLLIPVRWASERLNNKRTKHVEPKAED